MRRRTSEHRRELACGLCVGTSGMAAARRVLAPRAGRTVLHELVAGGAQTLLARVARCRPESGVLPRYVERELAAYLRSGILAQGFARVRCQTCRDEIVVAFSCERRGIRPSCTARRMADTAAHLVDRVLPREPYRQWVFTVLKPLRLVLARDPASTNRIGGLVVRAIGAWQSRVAHKRGIRSPLTAAVTFVQRFGGLVNFNVHFHLVVPDGVFVSDDEGLRFEMLPVPTNPNVLAILDRIMRQLARQLAKDATTGELDEDAAPDLLAQVQAEAASTWRSPTDMSASRPVRGSRVAAGMVREFLDACTCRDRRARSRRARAVVPVRRATGVRVGAPGVDRRRPHLVQAQATLARRPPPAVMEPVAFLRPLVGLIPPPRPQLVRYSGVFGPASKHRARLRAHVPADIDAAPRTAPNICSKPASRSQRLPWAKLLRRVFADDVLQCPCGGRRSVIAVTDSVLTNTLLTALELPCEPVTFAPARSPPQAELAWSEGVVEARPRHGRRLARCSQTSARLRCERRPAVRLPSLASRFPTSLPGNAPELPHRRMLASQDGSMGVVASGVDCTSDRRSARNDAGSHQR